MKRIEQSVRNGANAHLQRRAVLNKRRCVHTYTHTHTHTHTTHRQTDIMLEHCSHGHNATLAAVRTDFLLDVLERVRHVLVQRLVVLQEPIDLRKVYKAIAVCARHESIHLFRDSEEREREREVTSQLNRTEQNMFSPACAMTVVAEWSAATASTTEVPNEQY